MKKKQSDKKLSKKQRAEYQAKLRAKLEKLQQEANEREITRTTPKKPKKNVYKLVTMLVETQNTGPGAVCTTYKNRTVATFGKGALLDLMKPLMLTVRARHRFDRWVSQPTEKHREQAEKTYLKAKRLVLTTDTSAEGERAQSPFFYGRSLVNLCVEILSAIHEGLHGKTWMAVAVKPSFVASRPLPDPPSTTEAPSPDSPDASMTASEAMVEAVFAATMPGVEPG